jgi:hypothetical protein
MLVLISKLQMINLLARILNITNQYFHLMKNYYPIIWELQLLKRNLIKLFIYSKFLKLRKKKNDKKIFSMKKWSISILKDGLSSF